MLLLFLFLAYSTKLNKFPVFNINDDLNDLCTSAVSPNTTKATRYALNVWRYWCMTNGLKDHTDITKVRDSWVYFFQPTSLSFQMPGTVLSIVGNTERWLSAWGNFGRTWNRKNPHTKQNLTSVLWIYRLEMPEKFRWLN